MEKSNQNNSKHQLAILVELVLYEQIKNIDKNARKEAIENFIQQNKERFSDIPYEEYVQYVKLILERTENNIKRIKEEREDR